MAPAILSDASAGPRLVFAPRLRRAMCGLSLAVGTMLAGGDLLADAIDGDAARSTVQWATAKKKGPNQVAGASTASGSDRLKWRPRKSAAGIAPVEPAKIEAAAESAPLGGLELRSATGRQVAESRGEPQAANDNSSRVIVLTTGETPVVDPFADPFGDNEAKPGKPSELMLFPVTTAAKLQPVDEDASDSAPEELDVPDESPLEEMQVKQAPAEEMPSDELRSDEPGGLHLPSDEELAQNPAIQVDKCPAPRDLKPIREITNRIAAEPGIFPQECTLGEEPFQPRNFAPTTFTWKASALCHKPLYFEQVGVERYGHTWGPFLQPVVGGAHFFGSVILLPYKMGVEPPWECVYPLGYYRPGSCAPYTVGPVPISLRGVMAQAGATLGFVYIFAP
jgi:hypothetical protein